MLTSSTAVYNDKKEIINTSIRIRDEEFPTFPTKYREHTNSVQEGIYLHAWSHHFGHFILESLSRIWLAKEFEHLPLLVPSGLEPRGYINSWQEKILNLLQIKNKIIFIEDSTLVDTLYIPFPLASYTNYLTKDFLESIAMYKAKEIIKDKKIYISRSQRGKVRGYINQLEIEEYARKNAYEIFIPENKPIEEVLDTLSSAEEILAIEGSALFNLYLIENLQSKVTVIPRHFDKDIVFLANALDFNYLDIQSKIVKNGLFPNTNRLECDINALDLAIKEKKYKSLVQFSMSEDNIDNALLYQEKINKINYKCVEYLQEAYFIRDKYEFVKMLNKSVSALHIHLKEINKSNIENTLFTTYSFLAVYINHLRLFRKKSRPAFLYFKLIFIVRKLMYSFLSLIFGGKSNYFNLMQEAYSNINVFIRKI